MTVSGPFVAFSVSVALSAASAAIGFALCRSPFSRSKRLLAGGERTEASIVRVVPRHPAGQEFPSDAARIIVEFQHGAAARREEIVLSRTSEDGYQVGDHIEVLTADGRAPRARTRDEPNISYGTVEQIVGATLLILAALPYVIMLSVNGLMP